MAETAVPLSRLEEEQEDRVRKILQEKKFTWPMIQQINLASTEIAMRIWIIDNSVSMGLSDRHRIVVYPTTGMVQKYQTVMCTRWQELVEAVLYHAQLAVITQAPTLFHFVNNFSNEPLEHFISSPSSFHKSSVEGDVQKLEFSLQSMNLSGRPLLTHSIYDIRQHISSMKQSLKANRQSIALILATDGLPSDEYGQTGTDPTELFIHAVRILEEFPVILIIRLSTDDPQVRQVSITDTDIL